MPNVGILASCTATHSMEELSVRFCLSVTVDPAGTAIASAKEEAEHCDDWIVLSH